MLSTSNACDLLAGDDALLVFSLWIESYSKLFLYSFENELSLAAEPNFIFYCWN